MTNPPRPPIRTGGRIELRRHDRHPRLESVSQGDGRAAQAVYEAHFWTADDGWIGELIVNADGAVTLHIEGERPPAWLVDFSCQVLRAAARSVAGSPAGSWPRRITRWRASPEER